MWMGWIAKVGKHRKTQKWARPIWLNAIGLSQIYRYSPIYICVYNIISTHTAEYTSQLMQCRVKLCLHSSWSPTPDIYLWTERASSCMTQALTHSTANRWLFLFYTLLCIGAPYILSIKSNNKPSCYIFWWLCIIPTWLQWQPQNIGFFVDVQAGIYYFGLPGLY